MSGAIFSSALEGATVEEASSLAQILEVSLPATSSGLIGASDVQQLWESLSYYGSSDIAYALRGFEGIDYAEVVHDVCSKMKLAEVTEGVSESAVRRNEHALLQHLFAQIWDRLSDDERREILRSMNIDAASVSIGGPVALAALFAGSLGGFATYQMAVIVANFVARALLGRGLTFLGNVALTRLLSVALGPVGWIASGAWLAVDLMGPAYRKTVPAVVQVAALRELTRQREIIGIMGHGSTGKDSLLKHVFGIDTENIHPIPGSTHNVKLFDPRLTSPVRLMNFPGFGDLRPEVEQEIQEQAHGCTAIVYLFDGSRIPQREELGEFERFARIAGRAGPVDVIPVLNKWDKADDDERDVILEETRHRLGRQDIIWASLKPKAGNAYFEEGVCNVRTALNQWAISRGKPPLFVEQPAAALPAPRGANSRRGTNRARD